MSPGSFFFCCLLRLELLEVMMSLGSPCPPFLSNCLPHLVTGKLRELELCLSHMNLQ